MDNITQSDIKACLNKSPEEIVDFFKAKGCRITWDWQDDWQECQAKSFTVAKVMEMDILQDIKNELVRALDSGETLQTFKSNLESVLAAKGWWKGKKEVTNPDTGETAEIELGSNRRMRQIFETNLTTSYRAGQYKQQWESRESRPWWMYVCKMLPTSREEHKALHGKVFRCDDPFWDSFYPPNGFNCRCDVIPLTKDEINNIKHYTLQPKLDKDGQPVVVNGIPQYEHVLTKIETCKSTPTTLTQRNAQVTIDNRKMTYKQAFYQDGTMANPVSTDRGWNYNPGKAVYFEPDLSKYDDIFVKKYLEMKKEFDERLFNTVQNKKSLIRTVVTKEIRDKIAHYLDPEVYKYNTKTTARGNEYYVSEIREEKGNQNKQEKPKFQKEIKQAEMLADNGHIVYLIPEKHSFKKKDFDAIVDGQRCDFKKIDGSDSKVEKRFKEGLEQAEIVFAVITQNHPYNKVHYKALKTFNESNLKECVFIVYLERAKKFYYWHFTK